MSVDRMENTVHGMTHDRPFDVLRDLSAVARSVFTKTNTLWKTCNQPVPSGVFCKDWQLAGLEQISVRSSSPSCLSLMLPEAMRSRADLTDQSFGISSDLYRGWLYGMFRPCFQPSCIDAARRMVSPL